MLEELRETTTQYDLALDQTLQRIERKLDDLENRVAQLEQQQSQQVMR
jgi:phage shock protein A